MEIIGLWIGIKINNKIKKNMSTKQNDIYIEELQARLIRAIEEGNRVEELKIRQEMIDSGLFVNEDDPEQWL